MCTRDFKEEVVAALEAKPYQRVIHLVYDGQDYFIKRKLAGRREWLKGSSELTFLREFHKIQVVNALLDLAPEIVDFGSDYFVLKGAGFALDSTYSDVDKDWTPVYSLIGSALADLHSHKLAHGRPALRDFCYDPDNNPSGLGKWGKIQFLYLPPSARPLPLHPWFPTAKSTGTSSLPRCRYGCI